MCSKQMGDVLSTMFPNAFGLGVTATPQRGADGMGLGRHHDGVFDEMVDLDHRYANLCD